MHIESIRQRAEFLALETLVIGITRAQQRAFPFFASSLAQTGSQFLGELSLVAMKDVSPEQADLLTAELRDAWEKLMQRVTPPSET